MVLKDVSGSAEVAGGQRVSSDLPNGVNDLLKVPPLCTNNVHTERFNSSAGGFKPRPVSCEVTELTRQCVLQN